MPSYLWFRASRHCNLDSRSGKNRCLDRLRTSCQFLLGHFLTCRMTSTVVRYFCIPPPVGGRDVNGREGSFQKFPSSALRDG